MSQKDIENSFYSRVDSIILQELQAGGGSRPTSLTRAVNRHLGPGSVQVSTRKVLWRLDKLLRKQSVRYNNSVWSLAYKGSGVLEKR